MNNLYLHKTSVVWKQSSHDVWNSKARPNQLFKYRKNYIFFPRETWM